MCRADQRRLAGAEPGASSAAVHADEQQHEDGPSLTDILGVIGQLLAQRDAADPGFPAASSARQFEWLWQSGGQQNALPERQPHRQPHPEPASSSATDIDELQNSVQFVLARINSLDRRPLYWSAQIEELQAAIEQLNRCRQRTVANPQQIAEQVQAYVDTVNAQLDEFLTQAEARQQRRQQQQRQHWQASSSEQSTAPSAPPFASAPPSSDQQPQGLAPTHASSNSWQWKWGWGQPPAGSTTQDQPSSTETDEVNAAEQAVGTGLGNAASAAASVAASIYRRFATAVRAGAAPTSATEAQEQHAQQTGASAHGSASSSQQSWVRPPQASARQAQGYARVDTGNVLPVGAAYEAIRGIFDQHVDPESRLGQWGQVAQHLNNLHAQLNPQDRQQQDAGRMLAAAINAYSAYRRASAASQQP